jgi:intracellular sulfur oxidation DsrE/DsrF family protein
MLVHSMLRLAAAAAAAVALMLPAAPAPEASHLATQPNKHKIVYQLNEPGADKAKFVLNNMQNHITGVRWDHIEAVELVVFGPALKTFVAKDIDPVVRQALERLQTQGVVLGVCGNTMRNLNIALDQLPEGAKPLPQGGVVRLMELQEQGYATIRP